MSLYWQYSQGKITKEELEALTGSDSDIVEYRLLDESNKPISEWKQGSRVFCNSLINREIREINSTF